MLKISILLLFALIILIIFFIPPFHWSIVVLVSLLVASVCGMLVTVATKKRRVGIISGMLVFLIFILQTLHVLTPLNFGLIVMLGVSLLAL